MQRRPRRQPLIRPTAPPEPWIAGQDQFDGYGLELDLGDWRYVLDQYDVVYGPGWSPFHSPVVRHLHGQGVNAVLEPSGQTRPVGVRISPDAKDYSWRNEYVLLGRSVTHLVEASTSLFVSSQGHGAMVRRVRLVLDIKHHKVVLPGDCPPHLTGQAETKGRRMLDLVLAARTERRSGARVPHAVYAPWAQPVTSDQE